MTDLVPSLSFTSLPSERCPQRMTPVQKYIRKLADRAMWRGPNGFGSPSDTARRLSERYRHPHGWAEQHSDKPLPFELQPGAFIERCKPEERALLCELSSDDVANYELEVPYSLVAEWPRYASPLGWPQPNRTMWRMRGTCSERQT